MDVVWAGFVQVVGILVNTSDVLDAAGPFLSSFLRAGAVKSVLYVGRKLLRRVS